MESDSSQSCLQTGQDIMSMNLIKMHEIPLKSKRNFLFLIQFIRITFSGITLWLAWVDGDLFSATLHLKAVLQEAGVVCMRPEHFHASSGTHGRAALSAQSGKPGINPAMHFHMPFTVQLIWDMRQCCSANKT